MKIGTEAFALNFKKYHISQTPKKNLSEELRAQKERGEDEYISTPKEVENREIPEVGSAVDEGKAIIIAMRIMAGDKVPLKDEMFLLDFDKELYAKAKAIGVIAQNRNPKEYDSVFDDDEEDGIQIEMGGDMPNIDVSAAVVEAAAVTVE